MDGIVVDTPISAQAARQKVMAALVTRSPHIKAVLAYVWSQINDAISKKVYWVKFQVGMQWQIQDVITASLVKSSLEEYGYKITEQDSVHGICGLTVSWGHVERAFL